MADGDTPVADVASLTTAEVSKKRAHEAAADGTAAADTPDAKKALKAMPRKRFYRQRAHVNPLSTRHYFHPECAEKINWREHFGDSFDGVVRNVDVGCGYGGLLFKIGELYPDEGCVGMEIRDKVSRFVQDKIAALRYNERGRHSNICCIRTNVMRYLSHFFARAQLQRMFFLYPDPHFKKAKIKWRIISVPLIAQYAYHLRAGGLVYTVTDVREYHEWILETFAASKLFARVSDEELADDGAYACVFDTTEEGQKVTRNAGAKFGAVYRRTDVESPFVPNLAAIDARTTRPAHSPPSAGGDDVAAAGSGSSDDDATDE